MTNPELLQLLQSDTSRALTWVVREHRERCLAFAHKSLVETGAERKDRAEQLFSEALVILVDNVNTGRLTIIESSVGNYLISIMKFTHWGKQRKAKRPPLTFSYEEERIDEQIEMVRAALRRHLRELGDSCRQVLTHFYYDGLPFAEILSLMSGDYSSVAALRNKKSQCLQRLRTKVGALDMPARKLSSNA